VAVLAVGAVAGWRAMTGRHLRRDAGVSVLLITIDTLRADALGAYRRAGAKTPWMYRMAALTLESGEERANLLSKGWHVVFDDVPDDVERNPEVIVNDTVPHAGHVSPRHLRVPHAHF
jgi:hypothetical protein